MSVYKNGIVQDASAKVDLLQTDIGDFSGRTYDPELMQVLGVPDTDGKDLYTCLVTDRWDAVLGALNTAAAAGAVTDSDLVMAYIKQLVTRVEEIVVDVTGINGDSIPAMVGTDNAALASVLGALDTAAAAGAVTTEDAAMAYIKQCVTRLEEIVIDVTGINGDSMVGTNSAMLASVGGALADAANTGAVDEANTVMQYVKQLVNNLHGAAGITTWAGGAAPAANVSLAEVLEQVYDDVTLVLADTGTAGVVLGTKAAAYAKLAGEPQVAITTEELNQGAATYDLFLGTTKPVMLTGFSIKQPTTVTAGDLTSISIVTDDATAGVIINTTDGAVGNLLTESELSWNGRMRIETGTKIQLIIAGGATGVGQVTKITADYYAIEDTGYLAPQE